MKKKKRGCAENLVKILQLPPLSEKKKVSSTCTLTVSSDYITPNQQVQHTSRKLNNNTYEANPSGRVLHF